MFQEPARAFFATGEPVILRKADDSKTDTVTGIYDEGTTDFPTATLPMRDRSPHVTTSRIAAADYGEKDFLTVRGTEHEILDRIDDDTVALFRLKK